MIHGSPESTTFINKIFNRTLQTRIDIGTFIYSIELLKTSRSSTLLKGPLLLVLQSNFTWWVVPHSWSSVSVSKFLLFPQFYCLRPNFSDDQTVHVMVNWSFLFSLCSICLRPSPYIIIREFPTIGTSPPMDPVSNDTYNIYDYVSTFLPFRGRISQR